MQEEDARVREYVRGRNEARGSLDEMTRDLQWYPGSVVNLFLPIYSPSSEVGVTNEEQVG